MFGEIDSFLNLVSKLKTYVEKRKESQLPESIATRFIKLCEHHGVHRNQIPRFFGHGLTFADVQTDELFLNKLSENLIQEACDLFLVNREWLEGHSDEIYTVKHFYKCPDKFEQFVNELKLKKPESHFSGVLLTSNNNKKSHSSVLLIEEILENKNGIEFFRYYQCPFADFAYWKCRAYLTACVAIATKHGFHIQGRRVNSSLVDDLQDGDTLLGWKGESCFFGLDGERWYPDEMVNNPKAYLEGVHPESRSFGTLSALSKWKELAEKGFMNLGFGDNPADKFEVEYRKQLNRPLLFSFF